MFKVRATEAEWLDRPDSDEQLILRSHAFMRMVNRCFGGTRIVRNFLEREMAGRCGEETIRVLDIGAGSCDIAVALSMWAEQAGRRLEILCVERDQRAFTEGLRTIEKYGCTDIRAYHGDIFDFEPREVFDYAIGSMFFHHLANREILRLIRYLRRFVRRGVFINDLSRSRMIYAAVCLLGAATDRRVRQDALLSIRKGFVREELLNLLSQVENTTVSIKNRRFGRITAWIEFEGGVCLDGHPVFS